MEENRSDALSGRRVLIVEDEFFLADDLRRALVGRGADVVGPVNSAGKAIALVDGRIDFAILDVNVKGGMVFPLADALRGRGVPFVFATGYDAAMIPAGYRDVERWEKPFDVQQLVQRLAGL